MDLRIISDIHLEHGSYCLPVLPCEEEQTLVLAGDIGQGTEAIPYIEELSERFKNIIYVAGNHEYYFQHCIDSVNADITHNLSHLDNCYFLQDNAIKLDGVWFFGSTFWTDMGAGDWHIQQAIKRGMNDWKTIKRLHPQKLKTVKFKHSDAAYYNKLSFKALQEHLIRTEGEQTVVITHHAPSQLSVDDIFVGSMLNYAYHSTYCDSWLAYSKESSQIPLWVHGHMHNRSDYTLGTTRVVCNPAGYPNRHGIRQVEQLVISL